MDTAEAASQANDLGALGALIVVILILAGLLWFAYRSLNEKLSSVNRAVNNVPSGDPTMMDRITRIERSLDKIDTWFDDFNRNGWPSLPADIGNAAALTDTIRIIQNRIEALNKNDLEHKDQLNTLIEELREHVEWEMGAKYGLHGDKN